MDANKLIPQKNNITKNKKITEIGTDEIIKEMQEDQRHHVHGREGEQLE
jgi:hypothetical protein